MTKFQRIVLLVCSGVLVAFLVVLSFMLGNHYGNKHAPQSDPQIDTLVRTDTIMYEKPVSVEVIKYKDRIIKVPITEKDTVSIHDTTYIALQFEKKVYVDTAYRAVISGYCPSLDFIEVYQKTQTITKTITQTKLPEYTISPSIMVMIGPGETMAGAGLSFDSWHGRWQFSGTAGYGIILNNIEQSRGWYAVLNGKYNLIIK